MLYDILIYFFIDFIFYRQTAVRTLMSAQTSQYLQQYIAHRPTNRTRGDSV